MKKQIVGFLSAFLICIITYVISGCSQQNNLYQQIMNALEAEEGDDLSITVYYMDPQVVFRMYPTLEQLTNPNNESVTVYHLEGAETEASVEVIKNQLRADMLVPAEPAEHINARLYYVLENAEGEKLLEIILNGQNPLCVYVNGKEVKYHEIFYQIINPCIGYDGEDLWMYFGEVVDPPQYGKTPSDYPGTVWKCEDPKITLIVRSDRTIDYEIEGSSVYLPPDTALYFTLEHEFTNKMILSHDSQKTEEIEGHPGFYDITDVTHTEFFECRCEFSPEKMTAIVAKDMLFEGKYQDKEIVFIRQSEVQDQP